IPPRNLYAVTRAANYDNYEGVVLGECTEVGSGITDIHTGDWLCFQGADLSRGLQSFEARVAAEDGPGAIEIRIDSPDGALLGRCEFPATGGAQIWHTYTCALSDDAIAGEAIRDVYLVFEGSFNLSTFRLIA